MSTQEKTNYKLTQKHVCRGSKLYVHTKTYMRRVFTALRVIVREHGNIIWQEKKKSSQAYDMEEKAISRERSPQHRKPVMGKASVRPDVLIHMWEETKHLVTPDPWTLSSYLRFPSWWVDYAGTRVY